MSKLSLVLAFAVTSLVAGGCTSGVNGGATADKIQVFKVAPANATEVTNIAASGNVKELKDGVVPEYLLISLKRQASALGGNAIVIGNTFVTGNSIDVAHDDGTHTKSTRDFFEIVNATVVTVDGAP